MGKKKISCKAENMLEVAVSAMQEKKAKEIVSLDLKGIQDAVADYFLVCHTTSKTQGRAVYDFVTEMVTKKCGEHPYHREGYENSEWILIDYVDVVVHIFLEETRSFYNIESLWADAKRKPYESDK